MKNAILIHGWWDRSEVEDPALPTPSRSDWLPWLSKQLMMKNVHTVCVEMPINDYPVYKDWKREFERYDVGPETILVGHSCGGGFLVRWLSENKINVAKVVLVAPWMGVYFQKEFDREFFEFEVDPSLASRTQGVTIINSTNDFPAVQESVKIIRDKIEDINYVELTDKGHFSKEDLGTEEFPELLKEILK